MNADVFVYFDNVQYTRRDWRNRNFYLNKNDEKKRLTVPVHSKGNFNANINEVKINYEQSDWVKQHLWLLKESYRECRYFEEVFDLINTILKKKIVLLSDLNIQICSAVKDYLKIDTLIFKSSELDYKAYETPTQHLINICKALKTEVYISGPASKAYMNEEAFNKINIHLHYHQYKHPEYQQNSHNFIPYLSILDLLFRYGKSSKEIIFSDQKIAK